MTNPPYKHAQEFVEKALDIIPEGNKVIMLMKTTFLESQKRKKLFEEYPPKYVYVSSSRIACNKAGNEQAYSKTGSAISFSWFVWEKGFKGEPTIRWFN